MNDTDALTDMLTALETVEGIAGIVRVIACEAAMPRLGVEVMLRRFSS